MTEMTHIDIDSLRAEENFVADAQLLLHEVMLAKGISRTELAGRLGVSRARITQLFSSECKNFTVRLLARAMHALDEAAELSCGWTRQRDRELHESVVAASLCDPARTVVAFWTPDGQVVPPDDKQGARRSDPRIRAILRSAKGGANDSEQLRAVA